MLSDIRSDGGGGRKENTTHLGIVVNHQQISRHTMAYKPINYINFQQVEKNTAQQTKKRSSCNSKASQGKQLRVSGNAWSDLRWKISEEIKTAFTLNLRAVHSLWQQRCPERQPSRPVTQWPFQPWLALPKTACQHLFAVSEAWSAGDGLWSIRMGSW